MTCTDHKRRNWIQNSETLNESSGTRQMFDEMPHPDVIAWTKLISRNAKTGFYNKALSYFSDMRRVGVEPNETTFSVIVGVCSQLRSIDIDSSAGRYFHAKVLKSGFLSDVFVGTALVGMYSKYFDMVGAERAFQEITERNLVSFNALITGFSLTGKYEESLKIYVNLLAQNLRPDCITFTGLFSAVSQSSNYQE
ncbi:hypothetical protein MKX01_035013, partial [Papaver californicum]